jgi:hypothetical protein
VSCDAVAGSSARQSRCSYTESRRRCAKPLSSLKTGTAPILTWKFASAPRPTPCRARMPGHYSTRGTFRPRVCDEGREADATGRFFLCARCRAQVLICPCCDRGNIYCAEGCAEETRRSTQRSAGRRYQATPRGRRNHAERARRYRARQNKVTHHGSLPQGADDVMPEGAVPTSEAHPHTPRSFSLQPPWCCHWCGRPCSPFVRRGFLRRGRDP